MVWLRVYRILGFHSLRASQSCVLQKLHPQNALVSAPCCPRSLEAVTTSQSGVGGGLKLLFLKLWANEL